MTPMYLRNRKHEVRILNGHGDIVQRLYYTTADEAYDTAVYLKKQFEATDKEYVIARYNEGYIMNWFQINF